MPSRINLKNRFVTADETKKIIALKSEIEDYEKQYDLLLIELQQTNSMSSKFDEIVSKMNDISVKIEFTHRKISNLNRMGKKYGSSLDKSYSLPNGFKFIDLL